MEIYLSDYEIKVIKHLDSMELGDVCKVKDWCKEINKKKFINAIKMYIDAYGSILFSDDYTSFKKTITWEEHVEYFNNNKLNNKNNKK